MAKETKYFQHDYNARNNIKLSRLRKVYGAAGYGLYWQIVEMMHEDERSGVDLDNDALEFVSEDNGITLEYVCQFLTDCVTRFKLFVVNDGFYTANRVGENKERRQKIREKKSEAGKNGAEKRWGKNSTPIADAIKPIADAKEIIADAIKKMANDSKLKESKVKESKGGTEPPETLPTIDEYFEGQLEPNLEHQPGYFKPPEYDPMAEPEIPTLADVKMFFAGAGGTEDSALKFFNHNEGRAWRIGMSKIYAWRKIANNWIADDNRKKQQQNQQQPDTQRASDLPLRRTT